MHGISGIFFEGLISRPYATTISVAKCPVGQVSSHCTVQYSLMQCTTCMRTLCASMHCLAHATAPVMYKRMSHASCYPSATGMHSLIQLASRKDCSSQATFPVRFNCTSLASLQAALQTVITSWIHLMFSSALLGAAQNLMIAAALCQTMLCFSSKMASRPHYCGPQQTVCKIGLNEVG